MTDKSLHFGIVNL